MLAIRFMDATITLVLGVLLGSALGAAVAHMAWRARSAASEARLLADKARLEGELPALREQIAGKGAELAAASEELARLRTSVVSLESGRAELEERARGAEQSKLEALRIQAEAFEEQKKLLADAERILGEKFGKVSMESLEKAQKNFLDLANERLEGTAKDAKANLDKHRVELEAMVKPLADELDKLDRHNKDIEEKRVSAFDHLEKEMKRLSDGTGQLANALKKPATRGTWNEDMITQILDSAGFIPGVHYALQHTTDDDETRRRADVVIHLPHGRDFVIDCKAPLEAFQEGMNATDEETRRARFAQHAKLVREHVKQLASKGYWERYKSADCVIMFLPTDGSFLAAVEADPQLVSDAHKSRVYLANPSTVLNMIHLVGHVLREQRMQENAQAVQTAAVELYRRLSTFSKHLTSVGTALNRALGSYNSAVGTFDGRLLPQARKLNTMGVGDPIEEVPPLATHARDLSSPESARALVPAELRQLPLPGSSSLS